MADYGHPGFDTIVPGQAMKMSNIVAATLKEVQVFSYSRILVVRIRAIRCLYHNNRAEMPVPVYFLSRYNKAEWWSYGINKSVPRRSDWETTADKISS